MMEGGSRAGFIPSRSGRSGVLEHRWVHFKEHWKTQTLAVVAVLGQHLTLCQALCGVLCVQCLVNPSQSPLPSLLEGGEEIVQGGRVSCWDSDLGSLPPEPPLQ